MCVQLVRTPCDLVKKRILVVVATKFDLLLPATSLKREHNVLEPCHILAWSTDGLFLSSLPTAFSVAKKVVSLRDQVPNIVSWGHEQLQDKVQALVAYGLHQNTLGVYLKWYDLFHPKNKIKIFILQSWKLWSKQPKMTNYDQNDQKGTKNDWNNQLWSKG